MEEQFYQQEKIMESLNPSCLNPGRSEKIKLNFYFRTSLWSRPVFIPCRFSAPNDISRISEKLES